MRRHFTQLAEGTLEVDKLFRDEFGIEMLRPEARLILILSGADSLRIKEAMSLSGLSYRGFYLLLKRLTAQRIVIIDVDQSDGRVRKISLSPSLRDRLQTNDSRLIATA